MIDVETDRTIRVAPRALAGHLRCGMGSAAISVPARGSGAADVLCKGASAELSRGRLDHVPTTAGFRDQSASAAQIVCGAEHAWQFANRRAELF